MTTLNFHRDSLNGTELRVNMNARYSVLPVQSTMALLRETVFRVLRRRHYYLMLRGQELWASGKPGIVLSALVEEALIASGCELRDCQILLPLDSAVYCMELGNVGVHIGGTERILDLEQALSLAESGACHVLAGGSLTAHFDDSLELELAEGLERCKLKLLFAVLLCVPGVSGLAVLVLSLFIGLAAFLGLSADPPPIEPPAALAQTPEPQSLMPLGVDAAVGKLQAFDHLLRVELPYLIDKGAQLLSYDSKNGITVSGRLPDAISLTSFIEDAEAADRKLLINQNGWSVQARPNFPGGSEFDLPGFNRSYAALQILRDEYGFGLAMAATSSDLSSKSVNLELSKPLDTVPDLNAVAELLRGHAVELQELQIGLEDGNYRSLRLSLRLKGRRA